MTVIGVSPSRCYEYIQIANGTKTLEQIREAKRESANKSRGYGEESPLRSGQNQPTETKEVSPKTSESRMRTQYRSVATKHGRSLQIYSKKFRLIIGSKSMNLFDAEEAGLIEVFHDPHVPTYSYIVKSTGEVVSFFLNFHEESWPQWLKDHIKARTG